METYYLIIMSSPDKVDSCPIGPFESEEQADQFSREHLEPKYPHSSIHITSMINPRDFRDFQAG